MNTQKLVKCGLLTAIVTVLTLIVLPLPISSGFVNLGDAGVYLTAVYVGGGWGMICAGLGSALADLILGYSVYIPATLIIKGLAAALAQFLYRRFRGGWSFFAFLITGAVISLGYLVFETIFITATFEAALLNLPYNLIQALIGAIAGFAILKIPKLIQQ